MKAVPGEVDVVVRCRDEMPRTRRCLEALCQQRTPRARILFVDNGSTDGSREEALRVGARIHEVPPGGYVPGAVLNEAMGLTGSELVVFVNADAVALYDDALTVLLEPLLLDDTLCATYGRQVAQPGARPLTRLDYERTFGAEPLETRVGTFFSMAVSAIRRSVWRALPFDEELRYSEDVDWIQRARALGWGVRYVPDARFEKSRDYDLRSHARRRAGEGAADTRIHHLGAPSVWREMVRPLAGSVVRDLRAGRAAPIDVATRIAQVVGYYGGRRLGWPTW